MKKEYKYKFAQGMINKETELMGGRNIYTHTLLFSLSVHQDLHLYQPGIGISGHSVWDHPSKSDQCPCLATQYLCM